MKDYKDSVERVLREHQETKDDDFKLFVWICQLECPDVMKEPFAKVLWFHNDNGVPSFETIRRTRQKLQHDTPELRGKVYAKRQEKQNEYRNAFGG